MQNSPYLDRRPRSVAEVLSQKAPVRIKTQAVAVMAGPMAGAFKARVVVFEHGRRLWSKTDPVAYIHRHHALEAAARLGAELLQENGV